MGYARVSPTDQNPQLQIDALVKAGVHPDDIFEEKVSGASRKRPMLEAMMKDIQPGDIVIVWKLDRLGSNAEHLLQIAREIEGKGAFLKILDSFGLDMTTAGGKIMFQILSAFAEFERNLIRERTLAGLAVAREQGRAGGRTARFTDEQILAAYEEHGSLLEAARSLKYRVKGKERHMTKAGFVNALARARASKGEGNAE